jgi:hypothetical protein
MKLERLRKDAPDLLKASYETQKDAEARMMKKGYTYDKELSTMESKVFVNKNGKPVVAQRGSTRLSDWLEDGLIGLGLGKYGTRQQRAIDLNKKVEEKYGKKVNAVGHSLGGRLVENSGANGAVITYNKASGLGDVLDKHNDKQLDLRTKGDLPSLLSIGQEHNVEYVNQKNHSINPFKEVYNAHNVDNLFPGASSQ